MFDEINKMIEERFVGPDGEIIPYDEDCVCIANAVENLLSNDMAVKEHSVDFFDIFDNPGITIYCLSIAYICGDRLEHENYIVEAR